MFHHYGYDRYVVDDSIEFYQDIYYQSLDSFMTVQLKIVMHFMRWKRPSIELTYSLTDHFNKYNAIICSQQKFGYIRINTHNTQSLRYP